RRHFQGVDWQLRLKQERQLAPSARDLHRFQAVEKVFESLHQLIKGSYQVASGGKEYIVQTEGQSIPMEQAASGQGEITGMWPAFIASIWEEKPGFFLVEEPEAHLYPEAQQKVIESLALVLQTQAGNQIMVSTHSPYVLTAFDNLITAAEIAAMGELHQNQVKEIVEERLWIPFGRVSAAYVEEGELVSGDSNSPPKSILNLDRRGLGGSKIDRASEKMGAIFDKLLDIKYPVPNG
ncbi:MAG: AAA family ATPase, partial [Bacteroidota bacterium]